MKHIICVIIDEMCHDAACHFGGDCLWHWRVLEQWCPEVVIEVTTTEEG